MRGQKWDLFSSEALAVADDEEPPVDVLEWGATGRTGTLIAAMRIPARGTIRARVRQASGRWERALGHAVTADDIIIARQDAKPLAQAIRELTVPFRFRGGIGMDGVTHSLRISSGWNSLDLEWWSNAPTLWSGPCTVFNAATELLTPSDETWPRAVTRPTPS